MIAATPKENNSEIKNDDTTCLAKTNKDLFDLFWSYVVEKGLTKQPCDSAGNTALHLAASGGMNEVMESILSTCSCKTATIG